MTYRRRWESKEDTVMRLNVCPRVPVLYVPVPWRMRGKKVRHTVSGEQQPQGQTDLRHSLT